jgi:hypothetical protein
MTQAERRHDRLAVRLSLIISRLVAGETLNMARLAAEFGVSVRTLRRDFRERLMYLTLSIDGAMPPAQHRWGVQGELDALTFAHRADWPIFFRGWTGVWRACCSLQEGCRVWYGSRHSLCHRPSHWCSTVSSVRAACQRVLLLAESAVTGWPRTA